MGFFSDIQSLFKADSAGRYLAFAIKAVASQDKTFLPTLIGIRNDVNWTCDTEYCFHNGRRRADLAIYEDGDDEPVYLVEIKVRDNKDNDHTRGQFKDYKEYAGVGNKPKVFVISPFGLADSQMQAILDSRNALKLIDLSSVAFDCTSELVTLFVEYLRDAGYIMKELDDSRASAFTHFLIGALLPHSHGLGPEVKAKAERVADGPLVFADIVSNFQLFVQTFPSNPKRPTIQYVFEQGIKASRIARKGDGSTEYIFEQENTDDGKKYFYPSRRIKVGGKLFLFAYCSLGGSSRLRIGISFQVDKNSKKAKEDSVKYNLFAEVCKSASFSQNRPEIFAYVEDINLNANKGFPTLLGSQQEAMKEFKKLVNKLVIQLKKRKPELVPLLWDRLPREWLD